MRVFEKIFALKIFLYYAGTNEIFQ
ncbi:unknown protein [Waddlia chondrophila 2032/99]|uniref:Uncharacterized protein n=1 Tax=Waddlia chondrophila 2032/99 TaxID=765953 RepID=F8LBR1_9BACT|nr:unknown protein [Waddlia chondrophila 2032/99]